MKKGNKFGRLAIIRRNGQTKRGAFRYLCRCDCGKTTTVAGSSLKNGSTRSCGCLQRDITSDALRSCLSQQRFSRLEVIRDTGKTKYGYAVWECLCDCGNITYVRTNCLTSGHTRSCGCLRREREIEFDKRYREQGGLKKFEEIFNSTPRRAGSLQAVSEYFGFSREYARLVKNQYFTEQSTITRKGGSHEI
jgi:hypothetical protein